MADADSRPVVTDDDPDITGPLLDFEELPDEPPLWERRIRRTVEVLDSRPEFWHGNRAMGYNSIEPGDFHTDGDLRAVVAEVDRLRNALSWVWFHASMHAFGGAFDPKHMSGLAELVEKVLNGSTELPDLESTWRKALTEARELIDSMELDSDD